MSRIELSHIRKTFGGVVALEDVSLSLEPGRVHGLLGENGAGKTTIMSVLYGLMRGDSGQIRIDGKPATIRSPRDAIARGIGMVHQHFMLAGAMSVLDNVLLGDRRQRQMLRRTQAAERIRGLSEQLNLPVDPMARIDDLSVGQQQRVEILKALYRDVNVLILDEPTAVLTPQETDQLLAAMARLREQGKTIVFISHKLGEVKRICDDIHILRRGRLVWEGEAASATAADLARQMVGHDLPDVAASRADQQRAASAILSLENVSAEGVAGLSLDVGAEIVGIAGVDGNGQQELAEAIVGLRKLTEGRIELNGSDITRLDLRQRMRLGIAHIPNDRKREGLVGSMSLSENIAIKHHRDRPFSRGGVMAWGEARRITGDLVARFDVRNPGLDAPVSSLSGGNQQKLLLARELAVVPPRLIVAMNPTRGLDIAATRFVHEQLLRAREAGCAIVLISSELEELLTLSDRIAVLYRGRLTLSNFPADDAGRLGRLMAGVG